MAAFVFTDAHVMYSSVNISPHVTSVTLEASAEVIEALRMGMTGGWRERLGGLKDWNVSLECNQDFAAGALDATLFPRVGMSTPFAWRPTSEPRGPDNPEFMGDTIQETYQPIGNSVGELATASVTLPGNGQLRREIS